MQAVAAGAGVEQAVAAAAGVATPHYRFGFMLAKAQELVERLGQFGGDLLTVLEKGDAEELGLLQSRHEGAILGMTRAIKEEQVAVAQANLAELLASETAARNRQAHYQQLIDQGLSPLEQAQIGMYDLRRGRAGSCGGAQARVRHRARLPAVVARPLFIRGSRRVASRPGRLPGEVRRVLQSRSARA